MEIEKIDFNNERSEDCVLIDTKAWIKNDCCLSTHRLSGRDAITYITKALHVNPVREPLKGLIETNDTLLLTRVASEVAPDRAFALEGDDRRFYHSPILQVIGTFADGKMGLSTLNILYNRVLIKKTEPTYDTYILSPNDNTMIGEVVKVGLGVLDNKWKVKEYTVSVGDTVLIRDNVSTEIFLDGCYYYAVEESMIVGIFSDKPYTLENMKIISNSIIMEEYMPSKALNSILLTPDLVYEDLDFTDYYNRNLFKVVAADPSLTSISKNDILLVLRDLTNYVYFNLEKHYIISGTEFVEAKVNE